MLAVAAPTSVLGEENSVLDLVPLVSQVKIALQGIFGDYGGANNTQETFLNYGIGAAQVRSVYYLAVGDVGEAWTVQKQSASRLEPVVDGLPVVGHVIGLALLIAGDAERGWEAVKAATSGLVLSVFAIANGGVSALIGLLLSHLAISVVESTLTQGWKLYGASYYVWNVGHLSVGYHYDVAFGVALVVFAGRRLHDCCRSLEVEYERLLQFIGDIDGGPAVGADLSAVVVDGRHRQSGPSVSAADGCRPGPSGCSASGSGRAGAAASPDADGGQPQPAPTEEPYRPPRSANMHIPRPGLPLYFTEEYFFHISKNKVERNAYSALQRETANSVDKEQINVFVDELLFNYRYSEHLATLDMNLIKQRMTYLNTDVRSLITSDELKTVNLDLKPKCNSLSTSLGGVLKVIDTP